MKSSFLKLAAIGAISFSTQAMGLGFEALPVTGFTVASTGTGTHQPTGGTSQYRLCNPTGNYGSLSIGSSYPTATTNNVCALVPAPSSILTTPEAGFVLHASARRPIIINNILTGSAPISIGSLQDVVFRNWSTNECIYGTQLSLTNNDYDTTKFGTQIFQVNGVARGGFASSNDVKIAYARTSSYADVVFRAGRTFTSVQHRAASLGSGVFAPGYYNQPLTSVSSISINGKNSTSLSVPLTSEQEANQDANWIEFTTNAYSSDPSDNSIRAVSPAMYIRTSCTSTLPVATPNAIRLRQTWQDQGSTQEFIEVRVDGFVPTGGNANPIPVPGSTF